MSPPETTKSKDRYPALRLEGTRLYFTARGQRRLFFYLTLVMLVWGIITRVAGV